MANTTSATMAAVIEKRVSANVVSTLIQESVSMGVVMNEAAEDGIDRIDLSHFASLAVQTVSEVADLATGALTPTIASLDLDRQKGIAWSVTKRAQVQAKVKALNHAVTNGAKELAAEVDDYIFGLMAANGGSNITILAQTPLQLLAEAKKNMDVANVQRFDRFIIASPGFVQSLLDDSNVINADKFGSTDAVQAGFVSRIYGFTIVESSSSAIPAAGFIACQKEAAVFSRQMNVMLLKEEKALGVKDDYSMSHLYGAALTRPGSDRIIVASV